MYDKHPVFIEPKKNAKIWRYMDITKFLSILNEKSLFFSRMDFLGDPFEGSLPTTQRQEKIGIGSSLPFHDYLRKTTYVYSFHLNEHESAALWSIYTKAKQGVAIQSTFQRFCNCLSEYTLNDVYIGMVNYIDYSKEIIPLEKNILPPLIYKRSSFEYEKELRALIWNPNQYKRYRNLSRENEVKKLPVGFYVPINLDVFIGKIYIAPTSPPWIKSLLTSIIKKYGINKRIHQSNLDKSPVF